MEKHSDSQILPTVEELQSCLIENKEVGEVKVSAANLAEESKDNKSQTQSDNSLQSLLKTFGKNYP